MSELARTHHISRALRPGKKSKASKKKKAESKDTYPFVKTFLEAANKMPGVSLSYDPTDGRIFIKLSRALLAEVRAEIENQSVKIKPIIRETVSADDALKHLYDKYGKAGSVLKGARLRLGMTQKELAKSADVEQGDLSKIEQGKRVIGKEVAKRLAAILKIDYRILL